MYNFFNKTILWFDWFKMFAKAQEQWSLEFVLICIKFQFMVVGWYKFIRAMTDVTISCNKKKVVLAECLLTIHDTF